MHPYDEDEEYLHQDGSVEPTPTSLAHWLEEQYHGDDRFESVEVIEPGSVEGETVRVKFLCDQHSHFFVAVLEDYGQVRVGLATDSKQIGAAIEEAADETGDSLTEFLELSMDLEEELEHEVQHFQDDAIYFCSELPYHDTDELASDTLHDEIIFYLDGYMNALYDFCEG